MENKRGKIHFCYFEMYFRKKHLLRNYEFLKVAIERKIEGKKEKKTQIEVH